MANKRKRNNETGGHKRARIRHDISLLLDAEVDQTRIPQLIAQHHRISRGSATELLNAQLEARERRKQKTRKDAELDVTKIELTAENRKRASEIIRNMCLFDDAFFQAVFKDNERAAEELLRPILNDPDLTVEHISLQETLPGIGEERGVVIDLEVKMSNGAIVAVEVQRAKEGAVPERARFIHAKEDTAQLRRGQSYRDLQDVYVIVMLEGDPFGDGAPMYHVRKTIAENGREYCDGSYTIYTNGMYSADDSMGRLMHDMRAVDTDDMYNDALRETARRYKQDVQEGETQVSSKAAAEFDEFIHGVVKRVYGKEFDEMEEQIRQRDRELADKDRAMNQKDQEIAELKALLASKNDVR